MPKLPGIRSPLRPLNRKEALLCLLVNVAACPGLGTYWARRWAGVPQLVLAFSGFGIFLGVFGWMIVSAVQAMEPASLAGEPMVWLKRALALFGTAWVWAAFSGALILKQTLPVLETTPPPVA